MKPSVLAHSAFLALVIAAATPAQNACPQPRALQVEFVGELQRDYLGFTQGLFVFGDYLIESSGSPRPGDPLHVQRINIRTGKVELLAVTPHRAFGEGIALLGTRLFQLTWTEGKVIEYDATDLPGALKHARTVPSPLREGWGATTMGGELIFGDGSEKLYVTNPSDLSVNRIIKVRDPRRTYPELNELEFARARIYANVYSTTMIAEVSPESGCVTGTADLSGLESRLSSGDRTRRAANSDLVWNGIAYHAPTDTFFVTGKSWSTVFQIRMRDQASAAAELSRRAPICPKR